MISNTMAKGLAAALLCAGFSMNALAQADNTNSKVAPANFSGWMNDYSKANNGRISRDAYMQEAGRRWDALDKNKQGLTTSQIDQMYGYAPMDARPGTMAPVPATK